MTPAAVITLGRKRFRITGDGKEALASTCRECEAVTYAHDLCHAHYMREYRRRQVRPPYDLSLDRFEDVSTARKAQNHLNKI